jgi:serine/threonine-protein kinase RsbW
MAQNFRKSWQSLRIIISWIRGPDKGNKTGRVLNGCARHAAGASCERTLPMTSDQGGQDVDRLRDTTWYRVQLRSQAAMSQVIDTVAAEMTALRYPPQDAFAVWLCLGEAITNAFKHGNKSDPAKRVYVRYQVTPELVVARVTDEGDGFDPAKLPDPRTGEYLKRPHGRGVFLLRAFMSWVCFSARGNEVTICRRRSASE